MWHRAVVGVLLLGPWLLPWAPGPSPNTIPLLLAWLAAAWLPVAMAAGVPTRKLFASGAVAGIACFVGGGSLAGVAAAGAVFAIACCVAIGASPGARSLIATTWLLAAVLSSWMALAQYFGWGAAVPQLIANANLGEAYANLRQRNQFATLTALGLASLLWLSGQCRRRWVLAGALVFLAAANAASASRTGALQWLVTFVLALWWGGPSRWRWAAWAGAACVVYVVAAVSLPVFLEALSGQSAPNVFSRIAAGHFCGSRTVLWPNVLELVMQRPLAGWGWGELDYAHYAHLYTGDRFCDILDNAHNLPLHLAVELGSPAAVAICALALWGVLRLRPWAEPRTERRMAWLVLVVLALHSSVEYPLWYGPFQMALGFALGMLLRPEWPQPHGGVQAERPEPPWPAWVLAAFVSVATAYAVWDYRRISQLYLPSEDRAAAYREDTLAKARQSWLFRDQVRFAELSLVPLTRINATEVHALASDMLHFSPEPRVITKLIESAFLLGRHQEAAWHIARFRAAFPKEHAAWVEERGALPAASAQGRR